MTHICVNKILIIGSDNGLSPDRHQAIIWTNAGILVIWPLGTNFSEIPIEIQIFSFKKMCFKISSAKWRLFCLGLNVLKHLLVPITHSLSLFRHWFFFFNQCVLNKFIHVSLNPKTSIKVRRVTVNEKGEWFSWKCIWNMPKKSEDSSEWQRLEGLSDYS